MENDCKYAEMLYCWNECGVAEEGKWEDLAVGRTVEVRQQITEWVTLEMTARDENIRATRVE